MEGLGQGDPDGTGPGSGMEVTINGTVRTFAAETDAIPLVVLLESHLELGDAPVLVERNGEALLKKEFETTAVQDGDVLEIVRMVAGG